MKKDILKIAGIIAFFSLLGYALTYPYEVKLDNKDMVLIEDMHGKKFNTLEDIINFPELKGKNLCIVTTEHILTQMGNYKKREIYYTNKFNELYDKYKNTQFVYLYYLHKEYYLNLQSTRKQDLIRQWKSILKKHQIKGYHFFVGSDLEKNMMEITKEIHEPHYYPFSIFVTPSGKIKNTSEVYSSRANSIQKLDSLFLNIQKNDTIISK
ncbi:MAG: hypothetical protein KGV44_10465 [Flavobacteriaceae bacterium]|nr:hypothetical protein [Flavobacteriaceae bacterium]